MSSTGPSLDMNAFKYFSPNTPGIPKEWWGKCRDEYKEYKLSLGAAASGEGQEGSATKARGHAVLRIVRVVQAAGDHDQRATALYHALNHNKLRGYVGSIYRTFLSESVQVGLHTVNSLQELVRMIAEGADKGGRSKQCRVFLQMIVMSLVKGIDENDNVSHRSIF